MGYPHAASRFRINRCELRNRVVRTAHGTGFGPGINDHLVAFHEARARGGVGLEILETAAVHPSSPSDLPAYDDATLSGWARVAGRVHTHGTAVFQQLWHGGAQYRPRDGGPSWAPSAVPEPFASRMPLAMTQAMIDTVVEAYAKSARRCRDSGLDGVEIHGGHGYLVCQFLSPMTNRRTDGYGGSFENRMRFAQEVLGAVRAEVGSEFAVGIRLSITEMVPGGIELDDGIRTAELIEASGLVDFITVSLGSYHAMSTMVTGMHAPHGYQMPIVEQATARLKLPRIVAGRFMTLAEVEEVIARGAADLVSMVRATIADPDLVAKSLAGREAEVRPCLGINQGCLEARVNRAGAIGCVVNVHVGREDEQSALKAAAPPRRVLVAGAGPAGMEAARTAALRGHRVTVHEREATPGGLLRFARRAPHRDEIGRITDWLQAEMVRLGVEVRCESAVDLDLVRREAADVVVVATGSLPRRDGLQRLRPGLAVAGVDLPHVATPLEVLGGRVGSGRRAVVFDDLGNYPAIGAAEHLLDLGWEVVLASSHPVLAPLLYSQNEDHAHRLGTRAGYEFIGRLFLSAITPADVHFAHLDTERQIVLPADLVVLATGFLPEVTLRDELLAAGVEVQVVGDALAPLYLQHAIASGWRAGLTV